ncbi:hypothetical protein DNU06_14150 [Putridiphycobacter roseus]|uniref:Outer membrane protein beta-barrel domain-containing protein n=1 Tax=Putridiphycobacter roseus TaxID=2219161 RepID=A0A2W1MWM0_9FLAO|nr:hypothetical protein [Putridiphycobacter roseus]PZE16267.1 hypothetical protein DNU06_14150 [Putridiphycobacter roseus]
MKKIFLVFLISHYYHLAFSQNEVGSPFAVSFSIYGDNAIHPGLKLGGYYDLVTKEKSKERKFTRFQEKKGNKVKRRTYYGKVSIGAYSFANNHNGWFGNIGLGYERMKMRKGWLYGADISVGYLYRDYKTDTYAIVDNEIEKILFAGSGGIVYSFSPYVGRDFSLKSNFPIKLQLKPNLQVLSYSYGFVFNGALEIEFIYHFK